MTGASWFGLRPGIRRIFRLPLHGTASIHADVDEELESLIAARVDDCVARGLSPADARTEALRRLGVSLDTARHQLHHSADLRERHMHVRAYVDDLLQDVRYAARGLARRPLFTLVVVATLAIGIGATTAIFSAVNVLLLRPLPYPRPNELMKLSLVSPRVGGLQSNDQMIWSYPKYAAFRDAQRTFAHLALYEDRQFIMTTETVDLIRGESVGATYLRTLGLHTVRGHDFDPALDAHPGAPRQVLLSYAFWQQRFGGDPAVVGRNIQLDGAPYMVIGVTEPGFNGLTGQAELFVPVMARPASDIEGAQSHEFDLVGRRQPTASAAQAESEAAVLGARINAIFPDQSSDGHAWGANTRPLDGIRVAPIVRRSMLILLGAVTFVLLIACVNVANLLLGRASTRRREIAVRLAIGAGRARLVRLLLVESVLLATLGGAASIAVAWTGAQALSGLNPATALRTRRLGGLGAVSFTSIELDWRTLAFTLVLSLIVGIIFGLMPAFSATRASLADTLRAGASGDRRERGTHITGRRALVIVEVALAMVLLVGSGLMIRSLSNLLSTNFGFDGRNVLTLRLVARPGGSGGSMRDSLPGFYDQVAARLAAVPGITRVGIGDCAPLSGGCNTTFIRSRDGVALDAAHSPLIGIHFANAEWFDVLGVPLKRGRLFTNADVEGAPNVLLINETAARTLFPDQDPIGRRIGIAGGMRGVAEIIGVVGDVRQSPDSTAEAEVYASIRQAPRQRLTIFLRTRNDPMTAVPDIRRVLHEIAPRSPFDELQTMDSHMRAATAQARLGALLLGLFAATALSLAIIGIYGVMSLAVSTRTREIGIRIALGAEQRGVQRLVIREGMALVSIGTGLGLVAALASTRVLRALLFDTSPSDPATYVAIVALLGLAAITASWIPARRASRVDPVTALRAD